MCPLSLKGYKAKPIIMPLAQFTSLAEEVFPETSLLDLSCGFEPFMTKNFVDYLRVARRSCKGQISICTNALLINEKTLETILKEDLLDEINISIDGLSPGTYESIRGNGRFNGLLKVLESLKRARAEIKSARKLLLRINYTLMRRNIEELAGLHDFARDYSIDRVQLRHMRLTAEFSHLFGESLYYHQDLSDRVIKKVCQDIRPDPAISIMAPPLFSDLPSGSGKKSSCAYPWFNFIINSDGSVNMCKLGIVGNLCDGGFKTIEKSNKVVRIRKELLKGHSQHYCKDCNSITDILQAHERSSFIREDLTGC